MSKELAGDLVELAFMLPFCLMRFWSNALLKWSVRAVRLTQPRLQPKDMRPITLTPRRRTR